MFYEGLRKRTGIPVPSNLLLTLNFLSLVELEGILTNALGDELHIDLSHVSEDKNLVAQMTHGE